MNGQTTIMYNDLEKYNLKSLSHLPEANELMTYVANRPDMQGQV